MVEVSTSILSVEKEKSIKTFYELEIAKTDYFHIDVMDGQFVENDTIEIMQKYADNIKNISNIPLDVHLMVKDIRKYVDIFSSCNPNIIHFHIEAVEKEKVLETIEYIKDAGCKVGIAINPETKIEEVYEYLPYIHNVLIMSVHPGKGGQEFISNTIEKIKNLKKYIQQNNLENDIEVDGGINLENEKQVREAGANIAVVGTYLINSKDYKFTINKLKQDA